jgi:hypothetical protein
MSSVEFKPAPNKKDIVMLYISVRNNSNPTKIKWILLNVRNVKDMGTLKIIATWNPDASNAQVAI